MRHVTISGNLKSFEGPVLNCSVSTTHRECYLNELVIHEIRNNTSEIFKIFFSSVVNFQIPTPSVQFLFNQRSPTTSHYTPYTPHDQACSQRLLWQLTVGMTLTSIVTPPHFPTRHKNVTRGCVWCEFMDLKEQGWLQKNKETRRTSWETFESNWIVRSTVEDCLLQR